jgi:hypothetical protein
VPRGQARAEYIEPADGSITDGDDHAWSASPEMLAGGGGWRDLNFNSSSLLGKRARLDQGSDDGSSAADAEEIQRQFFPSFRGHESDDEEEVSTVNIFSLSGPDPSLFRLMHMRHTFKSEQINLNKPQQFFVLKFHTEINCGCPVLSTVTLDGMLIK